MPSKDNIKSFDTAKRKTASAKKTNSKGTAKPSAQKTSQAKTQKSNSASKKSHNIKNMTSYKDAKFEIEERRKIEHLEEKEQNRITKKEEKLRKESKALQNREERRKKRAERKAQRKEGYQDTFSDKIVNEVIGIIFIGLGIFMFMCLLDISTGVVGSVIDQCLHGLFGYFSYILPAVVILGGVLCIISANKPIKIGRLIVAFIAVVLFASWLQVFPYSNGKFDDETFMIFMKSAYNKGLDSVGTGALFSIITYGAVQLFGMAGAKLLLFLLFFAAMLIVTNQSLSRLTKLVIERVKENYKTHREKERELARSEMTTVNKPGQRTPKPAIHKNEASETYSEPPDFRAVKRTSSTFQKNTQAEEEPRRPNIIRFDAKRTDTEPEYEDEQDYDESETQEESRPTITEMPEFTGERRPVNVTVDGEILDDDSVESIAAPVEKSKIKTVPYIFPSVDLLEKPKANQVSPVDEEEVFAKAKAIEQTLSDFGIGGKVNNITHGPVITRYEYSVPSGTKMSKVTSLDRELAYSLECSSIRIEAPIPNKAAIGIEVPNKTRSTVYMRELLESPEFVKKDSLLAFAVGKDIAGNIIIGDIAKMPHTLISGATGSGKSVFINCILLSILYKASPSDVKLIMVDPKKVEFEKYKGIPHLMFPVVSNPKRAAGVLAWCVKEMEERYEKMARVGVRDLRRYNQLMKSSPSDDPELKPLPLIVIVIDELSDLMVVAGDEVEDSIYRLAQMARAAGMYLIIATQRPSVDVITGVIKANIPSRIALKVASPHDSRTIIDSIGAEQLLGNGDMIYKPQGLDRSLRVQGAWVSDDDVENVVEFIRNQNIEPEEVQQESLESRITEIDRKFVDAANTDELLEEAIAFVVKEQEASVSMLQRRFRIGHGRAGNLIDEMEKRGVVGPHLGSKPREVLISREEFEIGFTPDEK